LTKIVPVIISCDIDPTPEASSEERRKAFNLTAELFSVHDIKATFFAVAETAKKFPSAIRLLSTAGHEIGCHGLNHDETDEYSMLSQMEITSRLQKATSILSDLISEKIVSFRGPRVKTSIAAQTVLIELGYKVDSSVCSQRLDFLSSNLINFKWIFAPRLPYHPSLKSAFRRGNRHITVIPVSAIGLPFLSGVLYTFGLSFTKSLFNLLYQESKMNGKPIVYLLHPAEFAEKNSKSRAKYSLKVEGVKFRRNAHIFENDIKKRYTLHQELFTYIAGKPGIKFLTMYEYEKSIK